MDAASAPRPQSQSSIMMLAASAKNLAFEASHSPAITGSNATTPRDAINAGRVIDPAQLTPDDRDRRSSRHTRRDFEVSELLDETHSRACERVQARRVSVVITDTQTPQSHNPSDPNVMIRFCTGNSIFVLGIGTNDH